MNRNTKRIAVTCILLLAVVGLTVWNAMEQRQPGLNSDTNHGSNPDVTETSLLPETHHTEQPISSQTETRTPFVSTPRPFVGTVTVTVDVSPTPTPASLREKVIQPTCEEPGSTLQEDLNTGTTIILKELPPLGHDWSDWEKDSVSGMFVSVCSRCGIQMTRKEPYTETIPRLEFTGSMEGISKSERVALGFDFVSPSEMFTCYSYTTWQGHNTLGFPKKNYTIRLFDDSGMTQKHRLVFTGWQREHKYVLKANYRDFSQARNLVAANIWADMVAGRPNLYEPLRRTSNYGAVDGFPVTVYHDGSFLGLYTMNLHIDDDLYQMDNDYDAVMIANDSMPNETRFRAEAAFEDEKNAWEVEYCGTGSNDQWAKDKLNELIRFVMQSDDETFRAQLGEYLDVDAAVDYLIFIYVLGLEDNAVQDLVLLKYHDCDVWIPSVYDMEHAFGLRKDGQAYLVPDLFLPSMVDGKWSSDTGSLLWDRLLNSFEPQIRIRYAELRSAILTVESLIARINEFVNRIPQEYYDMDRERWPRDLPDGDAREQMTDYIRRRLSLLDDVFL